MGQGFSKEAGAGGAGAQEQLRVGLVIGQLTYGGAESQLYELARGLLQQCHPVVYCLSGKDQPYGQRLREAGVPVRVLASRGSFDVGRVLALARALREDRIQIVHAFLFLASAYAYLATRLARGMALVTSARNCKLEPHPVRRAIMRQAMRSSCTVICNSREMARFAVDNYGAPAHLMRVVYNGVDTTRFDVERRAHSGLRIGTVGRIEAQKNLDMFLDAAERVRRQRPDAHFIIVGDGSLRQRYQSEVERRGLAAAVRLPGTTADVPGFLAGLDQFWLTSDWEGTPNVVLEAMAAGVPVIATRVGGTGEVIDHGTSGFLVEAGDAAAVTKFALELAGDAALGQRIGEQARRAARERFSIPAMIAGTRAVYDEARALQ
ncbi:MAG TPA: glycosyltransferase [Candidatus Limnocylindrales bacterium]|nr:glycosyltransferase [Candidatus Limnocylindrales bacterium]